MAVMATHQKEGVVVDHKQPSKMAERADETMPTSNGVNGHVSPAEKPLLGVASKNKTDSEVGKAGATEAMLSNHTRNRDAFAANQNADTKSAPDSQDAITESSRQPPASDDIAAADPKYPTTSAPTESDAAVDSKAADRPAGADADSEMADAPVDAKVATDASAPSAEDEQAGAGAQADGSSTQTTAPIGSAPSPTPNMSTLAINASQDDSTPATADTSMTDVASQPQAPKVSREREDDTEEPAAKRVRTEAPAQASPEAEEPATAHPSHDADTDPMDVDDGANGVGSDLIPPLPQVSSPDSIMHPDTDSRPVSAYASREIRRALASVKKTKAGMNFRDSVAKLWPGLTDSYNSKVAKPMDIGLMERNLRGDVYKNLGEFKEDVKLLILNSASFNGADHDVTRSAVSVVLNIWGRLVDSTAEEPVKANAKKEAKATPTRHAEPRAAAQSRPKPTPTPTSAPPTEKVDKVDKVVQAPIHAAPPQPVPQQQPAAPPARKDSAKDDDRPKRPIHPPKKDLGYEPKGAKKKKLSPELKFCDEILKDVLKPKNGHFNWPFLRPVDEQRDGAFGYYAQVKEPMDLQTMTTKMQSGDYTDAEQVRSDFTLIMKNCFQFNPKDTEVHQAGKLLEEYFQGKWKGFDAFVAKSVTKAPARRASASSPSAGNKEETESEAAASDHEPDAEDPLIVNTQKEIDALQAKIVEEHEKQMDNIKAASPDQTMMDVSQSIIMMLSKRLVEKKKILEDLKAAAKKPAPKPKPASKSKKAAAGGGSNAAAVAPPKKVGGGGSKKGGGTKKGAARVMGPIEKEAIATGIDELDGNELMKAIDIIKKDTHQEENKDGELELEIEQISNEALNKLYDIMCKAIPEFQAHVRKQLQQASAPPVAEQPRPLAGKAQKPKKHKPMSKGEQERKLEELKNLKAKFSQQNRQSGSQEPPASTEPAQPAGENPQHNDSDESSEEE